MIALVLVLTLFVTVTLMVVRNKHLKFEWSWHTLAFLAAWMLTGYVLHRLPAMPSKANYAGVTFAWVLSLLFYVIAVAPPQAESMCGWRTRWKNWWAENHTLTLSLLGIVLLALALRTLFLGTIPHTLAGDEASFGRETLRIIRGELRNPFTTGHLSQPVMGFYFDSLAIRLLGPTITGLRLPWALVGTATVMVTFWLARHLNGMHLGLATAALLTTYHYHIHYSRLNLNNIADPLFTGLALLFLYRALDHYRPWDWVLLGFTCGGSLYIYTGGRLVPVLVVVILGYLWLRSRSHFWQKHRLGMLSALGAFLIIAAPILQFAWRFPDEFNGRINQTGIIQSGWLIHETEIRSESISSVLFDQFWRAALAFNFYPDRTVWYGLRQPLLDPLYGILFLLGLGYATLRMFRRGEEHRLAPMVIWWWGGAILGGMLTESPPSSQRLITLSVPVCFFIAVALWRLIRAVNQAFAGLPNNVILTFSVLLFGLISLKTYFVDYTPLRIYGGPHAELSTDLAPILNHLDTDYDVFFFGSPWMYWNFPTLPYLAPNIAGRDILEPLQVPPSPDLIPPGRGGLFIFLPERIDELGLVQQTFPNGHLQKIRSGGTEGRMLGTIYIVSPTR